MGKIRLGPSDAPVISHNPSIKEIIVEVPVEKIVEVQVEKLVEVIKEVPVEKIVTIEKIVEVVKEVEVPVVIREYQKVEVPVEVVVEKIVKVHDMELIIAERRKVDSLNASLKVHKAVIAGLIILSIIMAVL